MTEYPVHPKFTLGIVHGGSLTIKLNYIENLKIFKEWWKYLFVEGGGFVFRLVSTEVIRRHMFFFTLYYYSYNLWIKKIILALVYEILHKMAKCYTSPTFLHWYAKLVNSFRGFEISKYLLPKIWLDKIK